MFRWTRTVAVITAFGVASAAAAPVARAAPTASERASAQALFEDARKLMAAGKFEEACPKLEESQHLDPAMGTEFRLAECYEATGKTASAWINFLDVATAARDSGKPDREARARERAAKLAPMLSRLSITVEGTPAEGLAVTRDGDAVRKAQWGENVPVDPGEHVVIAKAPGKTEWKTTVRVPPNAALIKVAIPPLRDAGAGPIGVVGAIPPAGGPSSSPLPATPAAGTTHPPDLPGAASAPTGAPASADTSASPTRSSSQKTAGIVLTVVGVVGLGASGGLIYAAKSKYSDTQAKCPGNVCIDADSLDQRNSARSLGNAATIAFVAGSVAAVAGVVLWATATSSKPTAATASLGVGPGSVVFRGSF